MQKRLLSLACIVTLLMPMLCFPLSVMGESSNADYTIDTTEGNITVSESVYEIFTTPVVLTSAPDTVNNTFYISKGNITVSAGEEGKIKVAYGNENPQQTVEFSDTQEIIITGKSTANEIVVNGVETNITLDGVDIQNESDCFCAFELTSGASVNLTLTGTNTLRSGTNKAGLQIPEGTDLTIKGDGTVTATGGFVGAGIGGGYGSGGKITIEGGEITATGGFVGAGIGGGDYGSGGTITIKDGKVTATGGCHGAGIGGGRGGDSDTITIEGGEVTATGGEEYGAGIGGGCGGDGGIINIKDGEVTAIAGLNGAGIGGGGYYGTGGTITIEDGTVTAIGSWYGAGIGGGGYYGTECEGGKITIGKNVTLKASSNKHAIYTVSGFLESKSTARVLMAKFADMQGGKKMAAVYSKNNSLSFMEFVPTKLYKSIAFTVPADTYYLKTSDKYQQHGSDPNTSVDFNIPIEAGLYQFKNVADAPVFTITYELDGGSNHTDNATAYTYGIGLTLKEPSRDNYIFDGWYDNQDYLGDAVTEISNTDSGDKFLYAKWTAITYTITYELDSGSNHTDNATAYTYGIGLTLKEPSRDNYIFAGWYDNQDFSGDAVTEISNTDSGDKTLYAKWTAMTYTITYELDSGSNHPDNATSYTYGIGLTLKEPSRDNYIFDGWYDNQDYLGDAVTEISKTDNGDKILYAKWTAMTYTITYELDGGSNHTDNATAYTYGIGLTLKEPSRDNYIFDGWYDNQDYLGDAVTEISKTDNGDKILYAKWTAMIYTITYELDGGSNHPDNGTSYTYGIGLTLKEPSRDNYIFDGWYDNQDLSGNEVTEISETDSGDRILYAKWTAMIYTITYELDGGSNHPDNGTSYTYGIGLTLKEPSRDNYIFDGWYDNQDYLGDAVTEISKTDNGDKILYAKWTAETYTIAPIENKNMIELTAGYGSGTQEIKEITIERTGSGDLTNLVVALIGSNADDFIITQPVNTTLDGINPSANFTIKAKDGLAVGTYTTTVIVTADKMKPASFTITQLVNETSRSSSGGRSIHSGTLVSPSGKTFTQKGVTLTFPAGAVEREIRVKIKQISQISGLNIPEDSILLSRIMDIVKDKYGEFQKPVTITLSFDKSRFDGDKYNIAIYYYDEDKGEWIALDNISVDLEDGKVRGDTNHFTKFAVIATPKNKVEKPIIKISSDISAHWAKDSIIKLINAEVVSGYSDGTFQPNKAITRAEYTVMLVKALKLQNQAGKTFSDTEIHWAKDSISTAVINDFISGYDQNTFGPDDPIAREQAAAIIARATRLETVTEELSFSDSKAISSWARSSVSVAVKRAFFTGYPDNSFRPQANMTRAEAAAILVKLL